VEWERLLHTPPSLFHPELIDFCEDAIREVAGASHRLPSGPLHDAVEMCRAGVPTVMLFVQSLHGISHNKIEDTLEEHLELSVCALDRLTDKTIDWILSGER
jgi:N-carbamoyl-L-amino-acid hydrolase